MDDFKKLLDTQMQKAQAASVTTGKATESPATAVAVGGRNVAKNRPISRSADASARKAKRPVQTEQTIPPERVPVAASSKTNANLNRVTVNLFDADRRALAVIKELLGNAGHDFTNRSDSIKVALRIAAKAKRDELAQIYEQVKAEDRRFRSAD